MRNSVDDFDLNRRILAAISDDLSLPLLQIKNSFEAAGAKSNWQKLARSMEVNADIGLQLVEAYRTALFATQAEKLELEPLIVGSVMEEVAHKLEPYANTYDTKLEIDVVGRFRPVMAHRPSLTAALQSLAASLIRAQAAQTKRHNHKLVFGAHRAPDNLITAGVFSETVGIGDQTLRAARGLVGRSRQPISALPAGSASGVLIADLLCSTMWQPLRQVAHRQLSGLATSLPLSSQLKFGL